MRCSFKIKVTIISAINLGVIILLILFPVDLLSQSDSVVKKFDEIKVIEKSLVSNKNLIFNSNSKIDKSTIDFLSNYSISDVMSLVPSLYIKNYGGLGGMKTISLRGSTSSQTLILLDGTRLNSMQNGTFDLSLIPSSMIDKVEVSRGGVSTEYGANAIGGAVNLITSNKFVSSIFDISYSSFNTFSFSFSTGLNLDSSCFLFYGSYINSKGNYPIKVPYVNKTIESERFNSDFSNLNIAAFYSNNSFAFDYKSKLLVRIDDKGIPGAVLIGKIEADSSRLISKEILWINSFQNDFGENVQTDFSLSGKYNYSKFSNFPNPSYDSAGTINKFNEFNNFELTFGTNFTYIVKFSVLKNIQLNYDFTFSNLIGDMLKVELNSHIDRIQNSISLKFDIQKEIKDWIMTKSLVSFRYDNFSHIGGNLSSSIGVGFSSIYYPIDFRFSYSNNFRPPSFNEMYYLNYGTINLKPETSDNFNLNLIYQPNKIIDFDISYFANSILNQILSVPKSPFAWSAQNIGRVDNSGIEFNSNIILFEGDIMFTLSYTRQSAIDKSLKSIFYNKNIVYIPEEIISIYNKYRLEEVNFGWNLYHASYRYSLADNSISSVLKSYWLLDLSVEVNFELFSKKSLLKLNLNNVFDEEYSVILNYPMYPKNFMLKYKLWI